MTLAVDHLVVSATSLEAGVAWVEASLGTKLAGGGKHPHMATHNRLLGLGDLYLEVIAADPEAPCPTWPRWFDLDQFQGPPRLTNWVCQTKDMTAALAASPAGIGIPVALQRGDYRWQMAVPVDGRLPYDNVYPALIAWDGDLHPARMLPDVGIRLTELVIAHPSADTLRLALTGQLRDTRVTFQRSPHASMRATFATPGGIKVLT